MGVSFDRALQGAMNAGLILLFVAWRLMVVDSLSLDLCSTAPPITTPEISK